MMRERTLLANRLEGVQTLETNVRDTCELIELAEAEGDADLVKVGMTALRDLAAEAKRRETESLPSGEADSNDRYVEVLSLIPL